MSGIEGLGFQGYSLDNNSGHSNSGLGEEFLAEFAAELAGLEATEETVKLKKKGSVSKVSPSSPAPSISSFFVDKVVSTPSLTPEDLTGTLEKIGPVIDQILKEFK